MTRFGDGHTATALLNSKRRLAREDERGLGFKMRMLLMMMMADD